MPLQTNNRFFLTRHSANIMQDLHRRLKLAGSISLLHGARGIGKTRLLQQFVQNRIAPEDSVFVRFVSNNAFVFVGQDEVFSHDEFSSRVLKHLNNNSTLLIDQFEKVPAQIQQIIFKLWSHVAVEKELKMVISVQQNSLQALTDLSKRFHLQIDSVELKPLNDEEQLDYLRAYGCTELRQVAVVSSRLRKLLKLTNGLFAQLEVFKAQYSDEIICKEISSDRRMGLNKVLLAGISSLFILAVIMLFQHQKLNQELFQGSPVIEQNNSAGDNKLRLKVEQLISLPARTASIATEVTSLRTNKSIIANKELNASELTVSQHEVDQRVISAQPATNDDLSRKVVVTYQQPQTFFDQRLQHTNQWLESSDKKSASIQIMTLSIDKNPQQALNRYLKELKSKLIDLEKIKIFPLTKGNRQMYGVLFGEFKNLNMAYREIKRLPEVLKANKPFPRTVKGVLDEIDER